MSKREKESPKLIIAGVVGNNKEATKETKGNNLNIELRSGEVQELMSRPPGVILKSGITIILVLVIVFFASSYFIVYPEKMTTTATLFPSMDIECVEAPIDGRLAWVLEGMDTDVKKGDTLAIVVCQPADTLCFTSMNDGHAFKADVLERNMDVKAGQHLFYISKIDTNEQKHEVRGVIYLPADSSSILRLGQVVDINYKGISYPFVIKEFGSIANENGKHPISISYMDSLKLFKNIEPEVCIAKIRVSDQTIFEKFFAKRLNLLDKYKVP